MKKNGTSASRHWSRTDSAHSRFIGRAPGPLSPPTITQSIPVRSRTPRSSPFRTALALTLAATIPLGCYTGLDGDGQADPTAGDDAGLPPGANDDGPAREPANSDPAPPFRVPNAEARLLPFPVRMQNLAHVTGHDLEHAMFLELYNQPTAAEVQALADIQGEAIAEERRFSMTCIAVLTALDFVAV